ncbi:MAG: OmpA family protein [Leptospirales bacterium]|nr:OmpA family protein [Leptospirales bacterium]
MKKLILTVSVAVALGAMFTACQSSGDSSSSRGGNLGSGALGLANRALAVLNYSPNQAGYGYKSTGPGSDVNTWVTTAKDQINQALSQVGDGYVLQVTGHTDSTGPRTAPGDGRRGNEWYSEQRARGVMAALVRAGVPADKMIAKGVADDEPVSGAASDSQVHRRVTFQIVPKP